MKQIPKQTDTAEFKKQAVQRAQAVNIVAAVEEPDVVGQTLRNRAQASAAGKLTAPCAKPVTPAQTALFRRHAVNAWRRMPVDMLKTALA